MSVYLEPLEVIHGRRAFLSAEGIALAEVRGITKF